MKFEVDTGQLEAAAEICREILDEISKKRTKMYSSIRELDGMWSGQAHDIFMAEYEKDENIMNSLLQEIQMVIDGFSTARENYDRCEESAKDIAGKIRI